jgi:hypothetical protein
MTFADIKKNQGLTGIEKLQSELDKLNKNTQSSGKDDRFWVLQSDKSGVGAAVIRFLPEAEGDTIPYVELWEHAFSGPGGWYIEKSRTTLGKGVADPVAELNSQLWNSGIESNKEIARKQKRTQRFISNILVIKDPANPQNEGKVFLFKYGKKIHEKIKGAMCPDPLDDKEKLNPFCPWTGANFKLKCKKVDGYPNYDQSDFSTPEALFGGDDAKIEALWKTQIQLSPLVSDDQIKSYDDLKKRLERVLGKAEIAGKSSVVDSAKTMGIKKSALVESADTDVLPDSFRRPADVTEDSDVSDDLSYLQQLANED